MRVSDAMQWTDRPIEERFDEQQQHQQKEGVCACLCR